MKVNPKNFESWIDPNGGEWIRVKSGQFADVVWRPADIQMTDEGQFSFQAEFFNGVVEDKMFEKVAGNIIKDILEAAFEADNDKRD